MNKHIASFFIILFFLNLNAQSDSLKYYFYNSNYDKAITIGNALIINKAATANDYILIAKSYSSNFEYLNALNILKNAETLFPSNNEILYSKANNLYKYDKIAESEIITKKLIASDSLNKKYILLAINIAKSTNNNNALLNYNKKLLQIDSTSAAYNNMIGKTYIKLKQNKYAIKHLEKSIKYDSTYSDSYNWLAKIHDAFRSWDTSLYYINKALKIDPENISYLKQRANTNYNRVHYFRALPDFLYLYNNDTTDNEIIFKLGVCYLQIEKYDIANKFFIKSYNIDSSNYKTNQYLGMSYYNLKQYDIAVHYIEEALKLIQPDKIVMKSIQNNLAINYFSNKQYEKAIEYSKIMKNYYQKDYWYDYYIAESYFALNDYKNAKKYYENINGKLPSEFQENINKHLIVINEHLFFKQK